MLIGAFLVGNYASLVGIKNVLYAGVFSLLIALPLRGLGSFIVNPAGFYAV